jgi:cold shock CspA family protein
MPQGSVKEYDVNEKTGVIAADDGQTEWEIDPVAMTTGMFRFFRTGQRVTFDLIDEAGVQRVRNLRIGTP